MCRSLASISRPGSARVFTDSAQLLRYLPHSSHPPKSTHGHESILSDHLQPIMLFSPNSAISTVFVLSFPTLQGGHKKHGYFQTTLYTECPFSCFSSLVLNQSGTRVFFPCVVVEHSICHNRDMRPQHDARAYQLQALGNRDQARAMLRPQNYEAPKDQE